jgi:predicted SAM-dependent methyltransferase
MGGRPVKVHLGCGSKILTGWLNVDGLPGPGVDLVLDIERELGRLPDDIEMIYSSHVIEHIHPDKLADVMATLYARMASGGQILIVTTDILGIVNHRLLGHRNGDAWEAALFGEVRSTDHPMASHRNCFTQQKLNGILSRAGFYHIGPFSLADYPELWALHDYGRSDALVSCFSRGYKL